MRVMLSCGEASGDLYAGALVEALRAATPTSTCSASAASDSRPPAAD